MERGCTYHWQMESKDESNGPSWLPKRLRVKAEWMPAQGERPEGMYVPIGGNVGRTSATLRLFGEALDPDIVSQQLKCKPTSAYRKGDPVTSDGRGTRRMGSWCLESRLEGTFGIDDHVGELLSRVTDNPETWRSLSCFNPDIFFGLFLSGFNQGDCIAPKTFKMLHERGIRLGLDIYSAPDE